MSDAPAIARQPNDDKPHCECAIFAIAGARRAADLAYFGLYAMQHRGQESSGICSTDGRQIYTHKGMGEIHDVFYRRRILKNLKGTSAIGHNRYSTTGSPSAVNAQPLVMTSRGVTLACCHNGNITNSRKLKDQLERDGAIFQTSSDSELVLHLYAHSSKRTVATRLRDALEQIEGAYCFMFLTTDGIFAARDPLGFRPLALGKRNDAWCLASETCAFDIVGARYMRDVEPGELLEISQGRLKIHRIKKPDNTRRRAYCVFEHIYFARPDSRIFSESVDKVRRRLGRRLAIEQPADADIVISVPDSSNTASLGYSEESGIRWEMGLIRNHYVGRTFIMPEQDMRDLDVRIKFNPVRGVLKDQRVVVVDDSIVRGTTARKLVGMLRTAGAAEIHFRVSSPPIIAPCFYGIDMPTKEELIGGHKTVEQIRQYLGVDSLGYLSHEGMLSLSKHEPRDFCTACFSNRYPTAINGGNHKLALEESGHKPSTWRRQASTSNLVAE